MKKFLILVILISAVAVARGEEPWTGDASQKKYPEKVNRNQKPKSLATNWPRWAVHSNLLGFVQFGPVLTGEFNITRNLTLSAHARFSSVGALTPVLHQAEADNGGRPDRFSGIAFGGGPVWFFKIKKDKAYAGILGEYEVSDVLYLEDFVNEWNRDNRKAIVMVNTGYRFMFGQKLIPASSRKTDRFIREGLFLNTGIYAGAEWNKYRWDYTEPGVGSDDLTPREGTEMKPFGMLELSVGIEF
ncbi:MAG: hypothetical protein MUE37_00875 [Bacteroidales bacterium]|nr:hypothetical protein [Bacteroidales bacterium]